MKLSRWLHLLSVLVFVSSVSGQDLPTGPEKGKGVPALKVFDATGPHKDKPLDYAAERKGKPTVYVFIQADKWDRPMARFLRKLDEAVRKEGEDALVVAVWLTDNVQKTKDYLPLAQQSLQFQATALTCFPGQQGGPDGWGVNGDAHLTAVVAHQGRTVATFGYRSLNETDAAAVSAALKRARQGK